MTGRTFTLFGHHIGYSASPVIMAAAFAALDMPHRYTLSDVSPEDFPAALNALRGIDGGANVTVPHKQRAAELVDELTGPAARLGAVNTIEVDGDRLIGHNTDYPAILDELDALGTKPRRAAVLGAGGAASAVTLALAERGIEATTLARRTGTWGQIAAELPRCDLLINATPIGTQSDQLPVDRDLLRSDLAVFDLVYRPTPTALVAAARELGAPARAGAGMLAGQGARALEIWTGTEVPVRPMLTALLTTLGASHV